MAVRLTQTAVEVIRTNTPNVRLTQLAMEVVHSGHPLARLTQTAVEVVRTNAEEVPIIGTRTTQAIVEVLDSPGSGYRTTLVTQAVVEVQCAADNPETHVSQTAIEVLRGSVLVVECGAIYDEVFSILKSAANNEIATLTLGLPSPLLWQLPRWRFSRKLCRWRFKGTECGYFGVPVPDTCTKTLARCIELNNVERFGGFPAIPGGFFDA